MRFSVVIPAYNCSGTLVGTVDSIRASGLTDLEIILIDDGSTDGTSEVCDGLAGRFPEVRCVHQSNEGVSAARRVKKTVRFRRPCGRKKSSIFL